MYQSNDFCFLCHRLSLLINFLIYIYIYMQYCYSFSICKYKFTNCRIYIVNIN